MGVNKRNQNHFLMFKTNTFAMGGLLPKKVSAALFFLFAMLIMVPLSGQTIFGLSETNLVSFDAQRPNIIKSSVALAALPDEQKLVGADFRPATGELYIIGYNSATGSARLYTVGVQDGSLTPIGMGNFTLPTDVAEWFLDFNPTVDRIRLIGNNGSNFRLHPTTGVIVATDGNIKFAVGDVNEAQTPNIGAGAYTNSFPGTTGTVLYDYDLSLNILATQIPPNDGVLNTIGESGIMLDPNRPTVDLDIWYRYRDNSNLAFAVAALEGVTCNQFYSIDLATGKASLIGTIGGDQDIKKITAQLDTPPAPPINFNAFLSGRNQATPIATRATGSVKAALVDNVLTIEGRFDNLSSPVNVEIAGGAHIHLGYAGQNGPVALLLNITAGENPNSGIFEASRNTFTLTDEQLEALMNRQLYINIHSERYHAGEIRGQLLLEADAYFGANLVGNNEVPVVMTGAFGAVNAELVGDTLTLSGSFAGLEGDFDANIAGGSHVHFGLQGENGGIAFPIRPSVAEDLKSGLITPAENTIVLNEDQKTALLARGLYVNIHTSAFPSGEVRGQLTGLADVVYRAHLSGANEYPYVFSLAGGQVIGEVSGDQLIVSGTFDNLSSPLDPNVAGGAHLHIGKAGQNGGIALGLNPTMNEGGLSGRFLAANNTFTLTEEQKALLLVRGIYLNIHTAEDQAGEIRGQMIPEATIVLNAYLTGSQEVPQFVTNGHGAVIAEINGTNVTISGSFSDLEGDFDANIAGGSHIHMGLPGTNGGIMFGLNPSFVSGLRNGTFEPLDNENDGLTAEDITQLRRRAAYVNIHTTANASGEVRGNLFLESAAYALATLGGASQTTPVNSPGIGVVAMEISRSSVRTVGSFSLGSAFDANIAGGAHIHAAPAGTDGGIVFHLETDLDADLLGGEFNAARNTKSLSTSLFDTLSARLLYVNIHTVDFPAGEIRGQVLPLANAYFHTSLDGLHEVPAVTSTGSGSVKAELTGSTVVLSGSFNNLIGDFDPNIAGGSHVHFGANGENGGIAFGLTVSNDTDLKSGVFAAASNRQTLTSEQLDALRNGGLYVNIHTTQVASGEVRGNLLAEVNFFPSVSTLTFPADGTSIDPTKLEVDSIDITWTAATDPNGDLISYIWEASYTADFTDRIVQVDANVNTGFTIAVADFVGLLDSMRLADNDTLQVFHRVISKDGSNITIGDIAVLELVKDTSTSVNDELGIQIDLKVLPNISTGGIVNVEITSSNTLSGSLVLVNQQGQKLIDQRQTLQSGLNSITISGASLPMGLHYIYFLTASGRSKVKELVIQ